MRGTKACERRIRNPAARQAGLASFILFAMVAWTLYPASDVHAAAPAAPEIVAVRFYDDNPRAQGSALRASAHAELERGAGVALVARGRDADGAFLFAFALPQPLDAARLAVNRLRGSGAVLYAELAADRVFGAKKQAEAMASGPVTSIIVVMRDAHGAGNQARQSHAMATATASRLAQSAGIAIAATRSLSGGAQVIQLAKALPASQARAAIERFHADPEVAHVEIDRRAFAQALPADPLFASQWNLTDANGGVNAPAAWDVATGDPGMPIAVLDSGVLPHPDLAGRTAGGYDFIADARFSNDGDGRDSDASDPGDYVTATESNDAQGALFACAVSNSTWHGTTVNGTLGAAANNGDGISGITWSNPLVNVRVLGKCGGALSDVVDGLRWAVGLPVPGAPVNPAPARVVNLSFAGLGACSPILQAAITDALAQGAVIIAAAGNDNDAVDNHWPANCSGVITVAGTSRDGSRAFYSNHGAGIALSAPGGGIGGSIPTLRNAATSSPDAAGHSYGMQVGTSLAAPLVAGIAALALAMDPDLNAAEIRSLMELTARPFPATPSDACDAAHCGAGIVDAAATLGALRKRTGSDARPMPESPEPAVRMPPSTETPGPAPMPSPPPAPPPVTVPEAPSEPVAQAPSAGRVPVAGGWRAKPRALVERLIKTPAVDGAARRRTQDESALSQR